MKMRVTEQGVTIPRKMFEGVQEVEVRQDGDRVIVIPLQEEDSIWDLGSNPVTCGAPDASAQHDRYLYDPTE